MFTSVKNPFFGMHYSLNRLKESRILLILTVSNEHCISLENDMIVLFHLANKISDLIK